MGLFTWLNSNQRKNWHVVMLNIVMGIVMGLMVIPMARLLTNTAPVKNYNFEGVVLNGDNEPIQNATVLIEKVGSTTTGRDGHFKIKERRGIAKALEVGDELRIDVSAPGHEADRQVFELSESKMQTMKFILYQK